jgi:hypothetical protein
MTAFILQKAVYLLQQAEVYLGYHYRWNLRRPYSMNQDGVSLLMEYAFGLNPHRSAESSAVPWSIATPAWEYASQDQNGRRTRLRLTFRRRIGSDLDYTAYFSDTLDPINVRGQFGTEIYSRELDADWEEVTVQEPALPLVELPSQQFGRVRVERR